MFTVSSGEIAQAVLKYFHTNFFQTNIFDACVGALSVLRFADDKFGGSLDCFNDMVRNTTLLGTIHKLRHTVKVVVIQKTLSVLYE